MSSCSSSWRHGGGALPPVLLSPAQQGEVTAAVQAAWGRLLVWPRQALVRSYGPQQRPRAQVLLSLVRSSRRTLNASRRRPRSLWRLVAAVARAVALVLLSRERHASLLAAAATWALVAAAGRAVAPVLLIWERNSRLLATAAGRAATPVLLAREMNLVWT